MQENPPGTFDSYRTCGGKLVYSTYISRLLMRLEKQYKGVSSRDYDYVMNCLGSSGDREAWNRCAFLIAITHSQVTNILTYVD